jgi:hypothetical protein
MSLDKIYELKPANNQQVEDENALSDLEITRAARSQYQALFSFCMKTAFSCASIGWLVFAAIQYFWPQNAVTLGLFVSIWLPSVASASGHPCRTDHCLDSAPNCCSRSLGKCCNGNWACYSSGTCHQTHAETSRKCGSHGTVLACT